MTTASVRFSLWVEWTGYTHKEAAAEIGCSDGAISLLRNGLRCAQPPLAVLIEAATTDWPDGPIDSREWRSDWHGELVGAQIFTLAEARALDRLVAAEAKTGGPLLRGLRRKTRAIKRRLLDTR